MKKNVIISVVLIMTILGALFGIVFYFLFRSVGENLFLHCISVGALFGIINSLFTLFFINKHSNIKQINEKLKQEIRTDKLTGLISRRAFDSDIKAFNTNIEYSMIYLDIDDFGEFNNNYGHHVGDKVLKSCAGVIKNCIRNSDIAYRYGGEELVVLLIGCGKKEAEKIGLAIVESIRDYDNNPYPGITISAGIASMPIDAINFERLIELSDFAMLKAKRQGKNQVVMTS